MTGDDTGLLVVPCGVSSQLQDLSSEILEHNGQINRRTSTHTFTIVAFAEKPVNTANGKLQSCPGRACFPTLPPLRPHPARSMPTLPPLRPHPARSMPTLSPLRPHPARSMPTLPPLRPHPARSMPTLSPLRPHPARSMPTLSPLRPHPAHTVGMLMGPPLAPLRAHSALFGPAHT
ncbi:hypothetical protein Q8A67_025732 [Cirrhinus molitorella]|uniref:Uncharacterized protein n=1 Tax=Cirrhinus molitorella TaxID=172907 RepID=A0AA88TI36_9TELE|nr:hypothetical protein Q8A67_025732 [Cirrhinus molitorella]